MVKKVVKKIKTNKKIDKITEKTTLDKIIEMPGAEEILHEFGVPCIGCGMMQFEASALKIGYICKTYGVDLKGLLKKLNK